MAGQKLFTLATWLIGSAVVLVVIGAAVHLLLGAALVIGAVALGLAVLGMVVAILAQLDAPKPRIHHIVPRFAQKD